VDFSVEFERLYFHFLGDYVNLFEFKSWKAVKSKTGLGAFRRGEEFRAKKVGSV
jgi:hypothetical protein